MGKRVWRMHLSLHLILSELGIDTRAHDLPGEIPSFSSAELYSDAEEHRADILYVCRLSVAILARSRENLYFLCVRDRMADDSETEEAMRGILVIPKNVDLHLLFNRVSRIFFKVSGWSIKLDRSRFANEGIQRLLDLSEGMFENHISVMDGSYKLIAYTKGIQTDDYVTNEILAHGYHPQETVHLFQKLRRIEEFEKNQGLTVSYDRGTSQYVTVKKVFHAGGTVSSIVVMVCSGREPTDGMLELFQILVDNIRFYVDRDYSDEGSAAAARGLILDLLTGRAEKGDEVRARVQYAKIPFADNYRLCVFRFGDEDNLPVRRTIYTISGAFPQAIVFSYERKIIALLRDGTLDDAAWLAELREKIGGIRSYLEEFSFVCGTSNRFKNLLGCGTAYEQGLRTAETASKLKVCGERDGERVFTFEYTWLHYALSRGIGETPRPFQDSFLFAALRYVQTYDKAHSTDVMTILRLYLENECKASAVSALMHMHRNTILYHIGRVETNLGISLSDPDTRLKLLLAYKMEDFKRA